MSNKPIFLASSECMNFSQNQSKVVMLKFVFSKKATKIDKIFTVNLTLTT